MTTRGTQRFQRGTNLWYLNELKKRPETRDPEFWKYKTPIHVPADAPVLEELGIQKQEQEVIVTPQERAEPTISFGKLKVPKRALIPSIRPPEPVEGRVDPAAQAYELLRTTYPDIVREGDIETTLQNLEFVLDEEPEVLLGELRSRGKTTESLALLQLLGVDEETTDIIFASTLPDEIPIEGAPYPMEDEGQLASAVVKPDYTVWLGDELIGTAEPLTGGFKPIEPEANFTKIDYWLNKYFPGKFKPLTEEERQAELKTTKGKLTASFAAGVGDVLDTAGGVARWLGYEDSGKPLSEIGTALQVAAPPNTSGEFEVSDLGNPDFYTTKVARTVPFALSLIPLALGGYVGGGAIATAFGLGRIGATITGSLAGGALSRTAESAFEAGGQYDDAIARGKTEKEAQDEAEEVFRKNMLLVGADAWEIGIALAPTPKWVPGSLIKSGLVRTARIGSKMVIVGLSEGGEEVYQDMVSRHARGEEWKLDPISKEVFAIGAIMGMGMGFGGDIISGTVNRAKENLSADLKIRFDEKATEFKQEGFREDQAEFRALDDVASTPEGEKAVTEAVGEVKAEVAPPLTEALIKESEEIVARAEAVEPTNASVIEFRRLVNQAKTQTGEAQRQTLVKIETLEDEVRKIAPEVAPAEVVVPTELEQAQLEFQGAEAGLEGLKEFVKAEPAAKLTNLIQKRGAFEGKITTLTTKQFRDLTGRAPRASILTADKKHVRWDFALDQIADELGYESDEALKTAIEQVRKSQQRIEELEGELPRLEVAAEPTVEEVVVEPFAEEHRTADVSQDEHVPMPVAEQTPMARDIRATDKLRGTRQVFDELGQYELWETAFQAETELAEAKAAFDKKLKEVNKWVDKKRRNLVFRELENPGSVTGLTFNERRAVNWFKDFFDTWADTLDLSQQKRIKNYVTHIFEADIEQQIKEGNPLDPALARAMEYKVPKTIFNPFLQERLGATTGLIEDPFPAAAAYEARQLKVFYYEPLLNKIASIANDPEMPKATRDFLKDFSRRMTGQPADVDKLINKDLKALADQIRKLPGGEGFANLLYRGNPAGTAAYNFTSALYFMWLGFKPTSAIRNLSQHTLIMAETGPKYLAQGVGLRFTKEGQDAQNKSLAWRSRKGGAIAPGLDDSLGSKWLSDVREVALYLFRKADEQNVKDAFLAGYAEAKEKIPDASREEWIRRGDEVAYDTQYLYTKMNSATWAQSSPGRVLSVLTTWTRNWMELINKWARRKPSRVYTEYQERTGKTVHVENWSNTYKSILMYMAIVGLGYVIKEETRLRAWEYTGFTSLKYLAQILSGEFPALQVTGGVAKLALGAVTDDERMMKEGWNASKRNLTPGIVNQTQKIAIGERDWATILFYLKGKNFEIKKLKDGWKKDFEDYPLFKDRTERNEWNLAHKEQVTWSDAKVRDEWRKDNPLLEAKMFVVGQFTTLSTDAAREEVLRLIDKHNIDTELIPGYEKVFAADTTADLAKAKTRLGNLEKLEIGKEAEYYQMGDYASEVNRLEKTVGRHLLEKEASPLTKLYLDARDTWIPFNDLDGGTDEENRNARILYRQQFPDVEATLYLFGEITSFENPHSAEELLGLMKKYDIPPEAIYAFTKDPDKYDALFTQKYELETKWWEVSEKYKNYGNSESEDYIEDKELREEAREKLREENPKWSGDEARIVAIDLGADDITIEKWAERDAVITKHGAGSSEAMVWLLDNKDTWAWARKEELLTDDGADWNEETLRFNVTWSKDEEAYNDIHHPDEGEERFLRDEYLRKHPKYHVARLEKEVDSLDIPPEVLARGFKENFVEFRLLNFNKPEDWEETSGTTLWFEDEWYLMEHMEFYKAATEGDGVDPKRRKEFLGLLDWDRRDFRKVPTREVFEKYLKYRRLQTQAGRDRYRYDNYDLDLWGQERFGWKSMQNRFILEDNVLKLRPKRKMTVFEELKEASAGTRRRLAELTGEPLKLTTEETIAEEAAELEE